MRGTVGGRGINDADYPTQTIKQGKHWHCPYYTAWSRMLRVDLPVVKEWLKFSNFRRWMSRHRWKGKVLDRWLFGDGSMFGPEHCCFLPRYASNIARGMREGKLGIDMPHGENISRPYRVTVAGKHIGYYESEEVARVMWRAEAIKELKRSVSSTKQKQAVDALNVGNNKT